MKVETSAHVMADLVGYSFHVQTSYFSFCSGCCLCRSSTATAQFSQLSNNADVNITVLVTTLVPYQSLEIIIGANMGLSPYDVTKVKSDLTKNSFELFVLCQ